MKISNFEERYPVNYSDDNITFENQTICDLFEDCVKRNPCMVAIEFKGSVISYAELNHKADKVAYMLREKGLKKGNVVGLMTERSIEMIIGLIGILKAGYAYLPIDPDYPVERIKFMLEDSKAEIVLTKNSLTEKLIKTKTLYIDEVCKIEINKPYSQTINPTDLAYIIYTSGSTGKPKGVMIEHMSVVNLIDGITKKIDFTKGKKIIALTTISFDIFVLEVLLPLTKGLTVVLADESVQRNPKLLAGMIVDNSIDMLQMTPSRMQLLVNHDKELKCLRNLKEIMIGGEAFPQVLLEKIRSYTDAKIYNMYGPTETTVWSTVSDLTEKNSIDIGKPIVNTQIYIVDDNNNSLVKEGIEGELCIGGYGLARGYLNRADITAERFIPNPFVTDERMYKTGDLAKWLPDGNIEYLGRIDNQVKIRGHRVELGEIETNLLKHISISQAVVTAWQGKDNSKYLCAYFVSNEELLSEDLREHLCGILPDYMIPVHFIRLDSLPQTPNGKIDRKLLPDPRSIVIVETKQKVIQHEKKSSAVDVKSKIREILRDNIDVPISIESIDLNSNLADIGINSITFIKIVVAIEAEFGFEFGDEDLDANKFPTVHSLVSYVENTIEKK